MKMAAKNGISSGDVIAASGGDMANGGFFNIGDIEGDAAAPPLRTATPRAPRITPAAILPRHIR